MDISSLLARADAAAPLTLSRSGPATVARLAAEAVASGRGAVVVVRSRDELALMRGLTALFTPDLSVGRADKSARPETPAGTVPGPICRLSITGPCLWRDGPDAWPCCTA